jgi:hypothetical protein
MRCKPDCHVCIAQERDLQMGAQVAIQPRETNVFDIMATEALGGFRPQLGFRGDVVWEGTVVSERPDAHKAAEDKLRDVVAGLFAAPTLTGVGPADPVPAS